MPEPIVSFDDDVVRNELKELVQRTVADTLNALLEEEAEDLIKANRYERTANREAYCSSATNDVKPLSKRP